MTSILSFRIIEVENLLLIPSNKMSKEEQTTDPKEGIQRGKDELMEDPLVHEGGKFKISLLFSLEKLVNFSSIVVPNFFFIDKKKKP